MKFADLLRIILGNTETVTREGLKKRIKDCDVCWIATSVLISAIVFYAYYFISEPLNSDCFAEGPYLYSGMLRGIQLGCWSDFYLGLVTGNIINPFLDHMIYVVCIVISSVVLFELWGIRNRLFRMLSAAVLTVAPAITGQIVYIYTYHTFGLAFLCAAVSIAVFFKRKSLYMVPIAAVVMALSLGFYSVYFGVILFIGVGVIILRLMKDHYKSLIGFLKEVAESGLYLLSGLALYWIMMLVHQKLFNTGRSDYAGAGKVGILNSLLNVRKYIKSTYRIYFSYCKDALLGGKVCWSVLVVLMLTGILICIWKKASEHDYWQALLLAVLLCAIPPCANIMLIIMPDHGIQLHWSYSMQLLAPFCIAVIENASEILICSQKYSDILKRFASYIAMIGMVGLILSYGYRTYSSFRTLDIGSRHIKYYVGNALTHALEDDVRTDDMPIVFMGFVDDRGVQEWNPLIKYSYFDRAFPFWWDRYEVHSVWPNYCMYYFGVDIGSVSAEQYDNILNSSEFAAMEQYPSSKAYAVIDGCYVILMDRETVAE